MIRICVVDDENIILNYYKELFKCYQQLSEEYSNKKNFEVKYYHSGECLLREENIDELDVLYLDCFMGEGKMDGMAVASAVREINSEVKIIFLSSTPDFALKAYQVKAWNYIVKNTITKASFLKDLDELLNSLTAEPLQFIWRFNGQMEIIDLADIMYVERISRKNIINTTFGERWCYDTLASMEEQLGSRMFVRVNRSAFVNVRYIKGINNEEIFMKDGKKFYISGKSYKRVKNLISMKVSGWR